MRPTLMYAPLMHTSNGFGKRCLLPVARPISAPSVAWGINSIQRMNKHRGFRFGFLIWLALWLLLVAALIWLSYPTGALVFASISFLSLWVWNNLQAQRLHATLEQLDTSLSSVPSAPGLWGEIFYVLYRRNRSWQQQIQQAQSQQQRFMQAS